MPLILPGNVASATAPTTFSVANSCRFDGSSSYMTFTLGTETDKDKWTWSCWVKKCIIGGTQNIHNIPTDDDNAQFYKFTGDALRMDTVVSNATVGKLQTTRLFRDPSAWYHLVIVWDSANGTAGNRMRMYVNGVEETLFSTDTNPSSGQDSWFYSGKVVNIGRDGRGSGFFDGYMAEVVYIDGLALTPTSFGEFDEDSPTIWKPIDVSGLTFGNNGFYLDFEDSSALGNDVSGNNNDFGLTNIAAADQATDTPTNNFATWNPLFRWIFDNDTAYSVGNVNASFSTASDRGFAFSTIGVSAGKWYWEVKLPTVGRMFSGVGDAEKVAGFNNGPWDETGAAGASYSLTIQHRNGDIQTEGSTETAYAADNSDDDICMWALDMDNNRLWMGINGTWQDSGDPTSGATGTGDITTQISTQVHLTQSEVMTPCCADPSTAGGSVLEGNFGGCPGFAISSGNADANGYGNFEYAPPSGFYALCTKNLAEFGG